MISPPFLMNDAMSLLLFLISVDKCFLQADVQDRVVLSGSAPDFQRLGSFPGLVLLRTVSQLLMGQNNLEEKSRMKILGYSK